MPEEEEEVKEEEEAEAEVEEVEEEQAKEEEIKPVILKEVKEAEERTRVVLPLCTWAKEKEEVVCSKEGITLTYLKTKEGNVLESLEIQYPKEVIAVTRPEKAEETEKEGE